VVVDSCFCKRSAHAWDTVRSDDCTAYLGPSHADCDVRADTAKREAMRRNGLSESEFLYATHLLTRRLRTTFFCTGLGILVSLGD
jgi:hypothetical protein